MTPALNLCTLVGGCTQFYGLLFGILIVVFAIWLNKNEPSVAKMVLSVVISIILTAVVFVIVNPAYATNIFVNLLIGFGAIAFLYFSRTWSGFAGSVAIGMIVLSIYMYSMNPAYGFAIGAVWIVALVLFGFLSVKAYSISRGYVYRKPDRVKITKVDKSGNRLTMEATKGALTAPMDYQDKDDWVEGVFLKSIMLFEDPGQRADHLLSQGVGYQEIIPYDEETAKAMIEKSRKPRR